MEHSETRADRLPTLIKKTAHDVRTPLTSIAGFAELLIEDETLSPPARENAVTILDEAKRLSEMLEKFFAEIGGQDTGVADEG